MLCIFTLNVTQNSGSVMKMTSQLMLYREVIAVCSQIHTKHINTLCGQNAELLNVKMVVHIVTTGFHFMRMVMERLKVRGVSKK